MAGTAGAAATTRMATAIPTLVAMLTGPILALDPEVHVRSAIAPTPNAPAPDSGPVAITTRVRGTTPGDWTVAAREDPSAHHGRTNSRGRSRPTGSSRSSPSRSWRPARSASGSTTCTRAEPGSSAPEGRLSRVRAAGRLRGPACVSGRSAAARPPDSRPVQPSARGFRCGCSAPAPVERVFRDEGIVPDYVDDGGGSVPLPLPRVAL